MAVVTLLFEGIDKTKGVMDGFAMSLTSITDIVGGVMLKAFQMGGAAMEGFVKDAMEAEKLQVSMANTVKLANDSIAESNLKASNAVDIYTTSTRASSEEIAKLQEKLDAKEKSLRLATLRYQELKNPTEAQTLAYQYQVEELQNLQSAMADATQTTTSVIKANRELKNSFSLDVLQNLAQQFRDLAGGSDDAIVAIEQIAIRAGTITADQMPKFIQQTLDLGTVMGSTEAAATLLARAVEDPATAMNKAQRAGIIFDNVLEKQIKDLAKAGKNSEAAALVTDRLAKATSGAAAAGANTLSGRLEIMQNHLEDAGKAIGEALLPPLTMLFDNYIAPNIPVVEGMAQGISSLITAIISGSDPINEIANFLFNLVSALGGTQEQAFMVFNAVTNLRGEIDNFIASMQAGLPGVIAVFQPLTDAVVNMATAFANNLPMMMTYWNDMVAFLGQAWNQYGPPIIAGIADALNKLAKFWTDHGDQVMAIVNFTFRVVVETISGAMLLIITAVQVALNTVDGIFNVATELLKGNWNGALTALVVMWVETWTLIIDFCTTFMNSVLSIVGMNLDQFRQIWGNNLNMVWIIIQKVFTDITTFVVQWFAGFVTTWQTKLNMLVTIINVVGDNIKKAISGWVDGMKNQLQEIIDIVNAIINKVHEATTVNIPTVPSIPGRASGGPVQAGNPYLVGERGPELFVPNQGGSIVSNYNLTVNTNYAPDIPAEFGRAQAIAGAF